MMTGSRALLLLCVVYEEMEMVFCCVDVRSVVIETGSSVGVRLRSCVRCFVAAAEVEVEVRE